MSVRYRIGFLWASSLIAGGAAGWLAPEATPTRITFLAVGQGDCTVIRHGGRTILVDVGPASDDFDAGARIVAPRLRSMGIGRVDLAILTHPDSDHIGGLAGLASRIPIDRVLASSRFRGHPDLQTALRAAKVGDNEVLWLKQGAALKWPGFHLIIRVPNSFVAPENENDGSLFLRLRMAGMTAVLTGDAGEEVEIVEAGRGDWRGTVLKAGHHGSGSSTSAHWLAEVQPKVVIASCGPDNPFGHPSPHVVERVRRTGAQFFRTDRDGDIHLEPREQGIARVHP